MTENDAPFSKQYEPYRLKDLNGEGYYTEGFAKWEDVFENMRPTCPRCHATLSPSNLKE